MKRLLILLAFLALPVSVWAQNTVIPVPPIQRTFNLTTGSPIGAVISEQGAGYRSHTLTWTLTGTISTCQVKLQKSEDGSTNWTDLIAAQGCTAVSSSGSFTTDVANFVRVNATTLTGSGTVRVTYIAYPAGQPLGVTIDSTGLATSVRQVLGGTPGSASTEVQSIQGVASMTPVIVTGGKTNNAAVPSTTNVGVLPAVANVAAPTLTETFQTALSVDLGGGLRLASTYAVSDPCTGAAKTKKTFAISSATTTGLVAASASNKVYFCSLVILPISATGNAEFVEDASASNCPSPDAGLFGGTTDTTGANMVANQGFALGNGGGTIEVTASTNVAVCIITSTTAKINGTLTYVLAP